MTYEKLAQDRFPKIKGPTPAEEEYVCMPRSHMITKADLSKAGRWTQGCRKCRAVEEGDHSRTNARVAEILADDVMSNKDEESCRTQGRITSSLGAVSRVQVGGSGSSGRALFEIPAHSSSKEKDVVMDSADVEIPLADGAHVIAHVSSPLSKSITGTKRSRENDEECEDSVATKIPATTSVGLKRGRSDSSSSSTRSRSSSMSQEEDQKIDGEGDAVMHMNLPALSDEYKFCVSAKERNGPELRQTRGQNVYDVAEIFSPPPPKICCGGRAQRLRGGRSLDSGALCPLAGKKKDLSKEAEQEKAWNLFYKTKPELLVAFPPRIDQDWSSSQVDMAVNMCTSQ